MNWNRPLGVLFPAVQGAVLEALWRRPAPMTGREVHRVSATGSYRGTLAALERLVEQGLVDQRRAGQAREYTLNQEHLVYPALAAALDAFTPRTDLDDRLRRLIEEHLAGGDDVSLAYFGSFARGDAGVGSDIDLLLVAPDTSSDEDTERLVDDLAVLGRRWTGNDVQVYAARRADLRRAVREEDPIVAEWRRDAITILGPDVQSLLEETR